MTDTNNNNNNNNNNRPQRNNAKNKKYTTLADPFAPLPLPDLNLNRFFPHYKQPSTHSQPRLLSTSELLGLQQELTRYAAELARCKTELSKRSRRTTRQAKRGRGTTTANEATKQASPLAARPTSERQTETGELNLRETATISPPDSPTPQKWTAADALRHAREETLAKILKKPRRNREEGGQEEEEEERYGVGKGKWKGKGSGGGKSIGKGKCARLLTRVKQELENERSNVDDEADENRAEKEGSKRIRSELIDADSFTPPPHWPASKATDTDSTSKPAYQISYNTFLSSIEPYFQRITPDDLKWLSDEVEDIDSFLVPTFGIHRSMKKNESETGREGQHEHAFPSKGTPSLRDRLCHALGISTSHIYDSPTLGEVEVKVEKTDDIDASRYNPPSQIDFDTFDGSRPDLVSLEHRIAEDLCQAGLLQSDIVPWFDRANDEVSRRLFGLQSQLRSQIRTNTYRKRRLLEIGEIRSEYQTFRVAVDEIDREIEDVFARKFRVDVVPSPASKKRKTGETIVVPAVEEDEESGRDFIARRNELLLRSRLSWDRNSLVAPTSSIYDARIAAGGRPILSDHT